MGVLIRVSQARKVLWNTMVNRWLKVLDRILCGGISEGIDILKGV